MLEHSEFYHTAALYTPCGAYDCKVYPLYCNNNECEITEIEFDGTMLHVFNVNNSMLFLHSVLNAYTSAINTSSQTMNAYIKNVNRM